jgi:quercetin dioxygenase-like cupin family protein
MSSLLLRTVGVVAMTVAVASSVPGLSRAEDRPAHSEAGGDTPHVVIAPESMKWNPVNAQISMAVLSGSPDIEGVPFVMRLRLADGTRVPPHWHPIDEHLTVLNGEFHMGMGEQFDESVATAMSAGAYCFMPKEVRHFAWVAGNTEVQIHGVGPFKTLFVATPTP